MSHDSLRPLTCHTLFPLCQLFKQKQSIWIKCMLTPLQGILSSQVPTSLDASTRQSCEVVSHTMRYSGRQRSQNTAKHLDRRNNQVNEPQNVTTLSNHTLLWIFTNKIRSSRKWGYRFLQPASQARVLGNRYRNTY